MIHEGDRFMVQVFCTLSLYMVNGVVTHLLRAYVFEFNDRVREALHKWFALSVFGPLAILGLHVLYLLVRDALGLF